MATLVGFFTGILGLIWAVWSVIWSCRLGQPFSSLSIFVPIFLFFSGLQLTVAGIMGEYVGRIFEQVKNRPLYIIDEQVGVVLDTSAVLDS